MKGCRDGLSQQPAAGFPCLPEGDEGSRPSRIGTTTPGPASAAAASNKRVCETLGISPYPPHPVKGPVMLQSWRWLTFLHWRYEPTLIRGRLPKGLELDIFDGVAWIGLTPFVLENLRLPLLPALPWISRFPETNLRTYVRGPDGEPGIWFFSLDAARLLAVVAARFTYGLPYKWAQMRVAS